MIKTKKHPEENYFAMYDTSTGECIRMFIDKTKPILPLHHPELLDLSFGDYCNAGCSFCYANATNKGKLANNLLNKIIKWFGEDMTENDRPFQVALGGSGDSLLHPDFEEALKLFHTLEISPNASTSGLPLLDKKEGSKKLKAIGKYSKGCAVSKYKHLGDTWKKATNLLLSEVPTNIHLIIGEKGSTDELKEVFEEFGDKLMNIVLLPYRNIGRGAINPIDPTNELKKTFEFINNLSETEIKKFCYGALMEDFLSDHLVNYPHIKIQNYKNPEGFSGYVHMGDDKFILRKSSYNLTPKFKQI
jgi:hypothetical protein